MSDGTGKQVWVCLICGYVHHGDGPPESCPVCGADGSDFEAQAETVPAAPAAPAPVRRWRCLVCGYVHEGDAPPESCPVCGADADQFEMVNDAAVPTSSAQAKAARIVIVGGGIAGVSAAESARQHAPDAEITLVSREPELPYYRLNLTRYLAGEIDDAALPVHSEAWYGAQGIRLLRGVAAVSVSPPDAVVTLDDGTRLPYDRLVLATGAQPFVPPIPGAGLAGVVALRTVADARRILSAAGPGAACVCVGGGILGLETAGALARRGARVTVLEQGGWLLQRQLNEAAGRVLEGHVRAAGIGVVYHAKTEAILGGTHAAGVRLADGAELPAELVVIAAGVRPDAALASGAGLALHSGVVVDGRLAVSEPNIFAAGDCAEHGGVLYGLWEPARHQGVIAGMNAAGVAAEFGGIPRANTLKVLGVGLFSVGMVAAEGADVLEVAEPRDGGYFRFVLQGGRLAGALFVGDTRLAAAATAAVKSGLDFGVPPGVSLTVEAVAARLRSPG